VRITFGTRVLVVPVLVVERGVILMVVVVLDLSLL